MQKSILKIKLQVVMHSSGFLKEIIAYNLQISFLHLFLNDLDKNP